MPTRSNDVPVHQCKKPDPSHPQSFPSRPVILGGKLSLETADRVAFNPRKRWRRVQELVHHFCHSWLRKRIPSLSGRKKWCSGQADLKVRDVAFVMSTDTPRGKWPLGRIVKLFPGKDNKVRVVDV